MWILHRGSDMTMTIDELIIRMKDNTPTNEKRLRVTTCRSCGWPERMAGPINTDGYCEICAVVRPSERDREVRAIMSRRRDGI